MLYYVWRRVSVWICCSLSSSSLWIKCDSLVEQRHFIFMFTSLMMLKRRQTTTSHTEPTVSWSVCHRWNQEKPAWTLLELLWKLKLPSFFCLHHSLHMYTSSSCIFVRKTVKTQEVKLPWKTSRCRNRITAQSSPAPLESCLEDLRSLKCPTDCFASISRRD